MDTGRLCKTQVTALSGTGETTIISAQAQFRLDLVGLIVTTPNAAAGTLILRSSTGGTTVAKLDYPNAAVAPTTPLVMSFVDNPLCQVDGKNNNWTLQASVNASGYNITAIYLNGE